MYLLVYVSSAVRLFTEDELKDLLATSRKNNEAASITGMLLYKDGNFMQLLEGPSEAVQKTFDRIQKDARHRGIIKLLQEESDERSFDHWAMGFEKLDKAAVRDLHGYSEFFEVPLTSNDFVQSPPKALKLLLNFKRITR